MNFQSAGFVLLASFVLGAAASFAEDVEAISRPDIAAANCPAEWDALVALDPDLWADTNPIGIEPSFDRVTNDVFHKYFVWIMAQEAHVASIIGLKDRATHTQSYMTEAKAQHELSLCLTMTSDERNVVVDAYHAQDPAVSEERIRKGLFKVFDDYTCIGLENASVQILELDPEDPSFASEYADIMSGVREACN